VNQREHCHRQQRLPIERNSSSAARRRSARLGDEFGRVGGSKWTHENREGFMRRLILQTSVSIDGYVAALDKSHPWSEGSEGDEGFKR
jgi:hypothetical protein